MVVAGAPPRDARAARRDRAGGEAGATRILDVGLRDRGASRRRGRALAGRRVTGVDASAGMLAVAARELGALDATTRERVSLVQATADRLPFGAGDHDIVVTAFVLQLVPSRYQALREARRVLAPGGMLAHATWLAGGSFPADDAYADALIAAGLEPRDEGGAHDDPRSLAEAAAQLRRAGFAGIGARRAEVDHRFTPEGFLAFVARFDDEELFATLEPAARAGARGGPAGTAARAPARRPAHAAAGRGRDGAALGATLTVTLRPPLPGGLLGGRGRPAGPTGISPRTSASARRPRWTPPRRPPRRRSVTTSSSTRGARTRAMTSVGSAWIVTPSGATRSATVIVAS